MSDIFFRKDTTMAEALTKETFLQKVFDYEKNKEWTYNGELPAVVDFWAPWCGPCKFLSPIIEDLSVELKGRVNFYKVNTDEEQELAGVFGIQSIPSLLFIPTGGKQPMMSMGALPKAELKKVIDEKLLEKKIVTVA